MKEGEKVMAVCALTTKDNPFDPFDQFESWYSFDLLKGYDCCGQIARLALTSDQLSDSENDKEVERAIDEIIKYDPFDLYRKFIKGKSVPKPQEAFVDKA